jgi:hypothetical protein
VESGTLAPLPIETTTQLAFGMLGAAGQALAGAPVEEQARIKAEYLDVMGRLLNGLRA